MNSKYIDDNVTFVKALVAVIIGAVLVNLWIRVINNFTYYTLKLSPDSTFWAIMIALIMTGLLIIYIIFILDEDTSCQIKQNITGVSFTVAASNSSTNYTDLSTI
jgi:glycerol uptake facilitator-like aquaporin